MMINDDDDDDVNGIEVVRDYCQLPYNYVLIIKSRQLRFFDKLLYVSYFAVIAC